MAIIYGMQLATHIKQNTLVIALSGELDHHTADVTRRGLDEVMTMHCSNSLQTRAAQIVLDLANLKFMDSTGIGVLIGRYKKMREINIPIYISNPTSQAERIFKLTGLYSIMPKV